MNKYLTFAGTQPVYLGDIDFMQNAASDAFKKVARALMDSSNDSLNAILQGVTFTRLSPSSLTYSDGVVVLNGEILPVIGETISAASSQPLFFHVVSALSGERTFEDEETHACYDTRTVVIDTVGTDGIAVDNVPRLHVPSDDNVYNASSVFGFITAGKLIRKNGLWFVDLTLNVADGSAPLSHADFYNIPEALLNTISEMSFPAEVVLYNTADGRVIQSMLATISRAGSSNEYVSVLLSVPSQVAYGIGSYRALIPIF